MNSEEQQKEEPLSLSQTFKKAAKVSSLLLASSYLAINALLLSPEIINSFKGEKLTDEESDLIEKVFGDEINTRIVRKHFDNTDNKNRIYRAYVHMEDDRNIYFLGKDNISANYATDHRMQAYKTFVHEMTHIWQNQQQPFYRNIGNRCLTYSYDLTASSQFDDLCNEQQASAIADYTILFLSPWRNLYDWAYSGDKEQLRRVVEEKFPAAKLAREKVEQESAPAQEPLSYASQQPPAPLTLNL